MGLWKKLFGVKTVPTAELAAGVSTPWQATPKQEPVSLPPTSEELPQSTKPGWIQLLDNALRSLPVTNIPADRRRHLRFPGHQIALDAAKAHVEAHYREFDEPLSSFALERKLSDQSVNRRYGCIVSDKLKMTYGLDYSYSEIQILKYGTDEYSIEWDEYNAREDAGSETRCDPPDLHYDKTDIYQAADGGDVHRVASLLDGNPELASFTDGFFGRTPLHVAALRNNGKLAEVLVANKADVNAIDKEGMTPLHLAAHNGSLQVAELLIGNQADVNIKNTSKVDYKHGETPLHAAASQGRERIVELLLASNAAVDSRDGSGKTPLHKAAERRVADVLLANGADANAKDNDGRTPLHCAVNSQQLDLVQTLLATDRVDTGSKDNFNKTALDYAYAYHKRQDIAELLRRYEPQA